MSLPEQNDHPDLPVDKLTWSVLLGRWTAFARSAVALPDTQEGLRMRASIADIITLQAVWFSLRDLEALPKNEQLLGVERARWLIQQHGDALRERYHEHEMPEGLKTLLKDALQALAQAETELAIGADDDDNTPV